MTKYWLTGTADEAPGQKGDRFIKSLDFSSVYMKKKFVYLGLWVKYPGITTAVLCIWLNS